MQAVNRQHGLGDEVERAALHVRRHGLQRVAPRAGEVAQRAHAANVAHQHAHGAEGVAQRERQGAAQHGVVLVARQHARFLALEEVARDGQALGGEGQRVGAEVPLHGLGVEAESAVFVRAVSQ